MGSLSPILALHYSTVDHGPLTHLACTTVQLVYGGSGEAGALSDVWIFNIGQVRAGLEVWYPMPANTLGSSKAVGSHTSSHILLTQYLHTSHTSQTGGMEPRIPLWSRPACPRDAQWLHDRRDINAGLRGQGGRWAVRLMSRGVP